MRCLMLLFVLVLSVVLISGSPISNFADEDTNLEQYTRILTTTCDLHPIDSACAAHCWLRGKTVGYCNAKKVCVCK